MPPYPLPRSGSLPSSEGTETNSQRMFPTASSPAGEGTVHSQRRNSPGIWLPPSVFRLPVLDRREHRWVESLPEDLAGAEEAVVIEVTGGELHADRKSVF